MKDNSRSSFFTFVCSLVPGAGEMYLGMMKSGASTMLVFCTVILIASLLGIGELTLFLPIIWFYSFFRVHNLRRMSAEEFQMQEDKPCVEFKALEALSMNRVVMRCLGILLVVVGAKMCFDHILDRLAEYVDSQIFWEICYFIQNDVLRIAFGLGIIILGFMMIFGKRTKSTEESLVEDQEVIDGRD